MKNTIIALAASAVALGSVNAQTNFDWADLFTSVGSTSGSTTVIDNGVAVNVTATSTQAVSFRSGSLVGWNNDPSITLTFSAPVDLLAGFSSLNVPGEQVTSAGSSNLFIGSAQVPIPNGVAHDGVTASSASNPGGAIFSHSGVSSVTFDLASLGNTIVTGSGSESSSGSSVGFIDLQLTAVPEPSSALLLGLGALGFLGRRKR